MKGVLLAGGTGSRMSPLTRVTNKHLLPVYDRPMICYPLGNLIAAGVEDIYIVTGGEHFQAIGNLLGSGKAFPEKLGFNGKKVNLSYGIQDRAGGIAEALGLARKFVGQDSVAVILGDNIYEDPNFMTSAVRSFSRGAHLFLKPIPDRHLFEGQGEQRKAKYGIAELGEFGRNVIGIEEKPAKPKSDLAVAGAYLYDNDVFEIIDTLVPSGRGELEITDVNNAYIRRGQVGYSMVPGYWTDAGSIPTLLRATLLAAQSAAKREGKPFDLERIIG